MGVPVHSSVFSHTHHTQFARPEIQILRQNYWRLGNVEIGVCSGVSGGVKTWQHWRVSQNPPYWCHLVRPKSRGWCSFLSSWLSWVDIKTSCGTTLPAIDARCRRNYDDSCLPCLRVSIVYVFWSWDVETCRFSSVFIFSYFLGAFIGMSLTSIGLHIASNVVEFSFVLFHSP